MISDFGATPIHIPLVNRCGLTVLGTPTLHTMYDIVVWNLYV